MKHAPARSRRRTFDTVFNVAQLLQEPTGAHREYQFELDWFALDSDLMSRDVKVKVELLRLTNGIMATGEFTGIGLIECVRCLEIYDQPFKGDFEQEYRSDAGDLFSVSVEYDEPDEEETLLINELHELDVAEPLRQGIILSLPMQPICRDDCPGLLEQDVDDDVGDRRFAVLASLLEEQDEDGE